METGVDILRAWVARMIMLGLYMTNKVPFRDVFLHGLILDEHGQKMSKSKGNVVNPMEIIDKYGSDALRIGIIMNRSAGQAQAFSEASVVAGRNFCNKLWNIARYIEDKADSANVTNEDVDNAEPETIADHWILSRLEQARVDLSNHITNYRFAEAVETVYHAVWDELADWYIEASKVEANPAFMRRVLGITLRLVHPFAPFVTETIWTTIRGQESLLISQPWPSELKFSKTKAADFETIVELVNELRNIQGQLPNRKYRLVYDESKVVEDNEELLQLMKHLLQRAYRVVTARNGQDAVTIVNNEEVDLIVTDVMMPVMDGIELCKFVKSKLEYSHIPIILLTVKNREEDRAEAYEVGADAFISKPFHASVLRARIRNLLKTRERMMSDFRKQFTFQVKDLEYTDMDKEFVQRAIDCITRHAADEMGTSKSTLYRKLKSLTGMTTTNFIRNVRLKAACRLLEERKDTIRISELAYSVGFSDPKYFSVCFKKEFGVLPTEYLEHVLQKK